MNAERTAYAAGEKRCNFDRFAITTLYVHKKSISFGLKCMLYVAKARKQLMFCHKNITWFLKVSFIPIFNIKEKSDP